MKGLILKNIYSSGVKIKHVICLFTVLMIVSFLAPIDEFIPTISYTLLVFSPSVLILSIANQSKMGDYKNEIILPVDKSKIIISKYVMYLIVFFICVPIVIAFLYVNYRLGRTQIQSYERNLITIGIGMTLLFGGILFPAILVFGQEKLKAIGLASFVLTLLPIRIFMQFLKYALKLDSVFDIYEYKGLILIFIITCFIFYVFSCVLSIFIFNNKEF